MKTIDFAQQAQNILDLFENKNYKEAKDLYAQCMAHVFSEEC